MKLGVCSSVYADLPLEQALDRFALYGIESLEIYSGGTGVNNHINVEELLESKQNREVYLDKFKRRNMQIGSLNATGNPVHPVEGIREAAHEGFVRTVKLAEKMGIDTVVVFSGTPGGAAADTTPNWITCPWPDEYSAILEYQWNEVLIPYWQNAAAIARDYGVSKIGFEMHPGFCVYNPETLLKLREAVGPEIGCNFDPSHLMWQGMDASLAALELKDVIYSVHAKDVFVNKDYISRNGCNDAKHYSNLLRRAWTFRTVGYGHDERVWKQLLSTLSMVGYDGAVNIEHEDALLSRKEGLEKACTFLRKLVIKDKPEEMWWA